ncbi:MAG: thiamine phosphate synthase [Dehalococcoidales bacterium]
MTNDQLRIIDANINRLGEGLRILEEFARMTLNDVTLTQKLKNIRHKTIVVDTKLQKRLLQARDAGRDVGSSMDVNDEEKSRDIAGIITANAKRVQESLRVLEEMAKNPELNLNTENYRKMRFELYTIEKELTGRILRKDKVAQIAGLYAVIDTEWLKGNKPTKIAEQIIKGGAKIIQLRCKQCSSQEFLAIAKDLKETCLKKGVLFIINDSLEVALAVGADGLHVGQDDMPVAEARKLMPIDMILGCSVSTVAEAIKAKEDGADYLGVGAIFATETKESAQVVGVKRIEEIKQAVDLPIVAIGGINRENLSEVMKAGADAAAIISAIMGAADIEKATRELVNIIKRTKK